MTNPVRNSTRPQKNAYLCNPENLLLSMLADNDVQIRQKAVNIILDIRTNSSSLDRLKFAHLIFLQYGSLLKHMRILLIGKHLKSQNRLLQIPLKEVLINSVRTPIEIPGSL